MNMIKRTIACIMAIACLICAGCSERKNIDAQGMAQALLEGGVFAEELSAVSAAITNKRYGVTDSMVEETIAYAGTKAVVDEIVIFKTKDNNDAAVADKAKEYIESQRAQYQSYRPDEVPKLQNCYIEPNADYVVVCVAEDIEKAKEIINEYTN